MCARTSPSARRIKTSFNNTIVTLTDKDGNVIVWESAGSAGFKELPEVDAVAAPGHGRRAREGAWSTASRRSRCSSKGPARVADSDPVAPGLELEILGVKDVTPQAHNGVRPKKRRRV